MLFKKLITLSFFTLCFADWNKFMDADINFPSNTYIIQCGSNCTITGQIQFNKNVQYSLTIYDSSQPMFNNPIYSSNNSGGLAQWSFTYTVNASGNYFIRIYETGVPKQCFNYQITLSTSNPVSSSSYQSSIISQYNDPVVCIDSLPNNNQVPYRYKLTSQIKQTTSVYKLTFDSGTANQQLIVQNQLNYVEAAHRNQMVIFLFKTTTPSSRVITVYFQLEYQDKSDNDVSGTLGAVLGIVLGTVALVVILAVVGVCCYRRCRHQAEEEKYVEGSSGVIVQRKSKNQIKRNIKDIGDMACAICLENGVDARIQCGHYFHLRCMVSWMKKNNVCPLCRKQILNLRSFEAEKVGSEMELSSI